MLRVKQSACTRGQVFIDLAETHDRRGTVSSVVPRIGRERLDRAVSLQARNGDSLRHWVHNRSRGFDACENFRS